MFKKILSLLLATSFVTGTAAALSGCNTVEGAGKDLQQGGRAISNEAQERKKGD